VTMVAKEIPTLELTNVELRVLATTLLHRDLINVFWKKDAPEVEKIVHAISQKVSQFIVDNKIGDSKKPVIFQVRVLGRDGGSR